MGQGLWGATEMLRWDPSLLEFLLRILMLESGVRVRKSRSEPCLGVRLRARKSS
jgi:hypothetical protein